eukprot:5970035-Alexandrium_andersonii.AAC.1
MLCTVGSSAMYGVRLMIWSSTSCTLGAGAGPTRACRATGRAPNGNALQKAAPGQAVAAGAM